MYVDANVIIYANFDDGIKGRSARRMLESDDLWSSPLVLDEVLWVLRRNGFSELSAKIIAECYTLMRIEPVPADAPLSAVRYLSKLKPRDAMHVAIMQSRGETKLLSDDADFDKVSGVVRVKL